jgi:hypothetical protein
MYRSTFFLTSALAGSEWSASRLGRFTPREKSPGTGWIGGWVDPRARLCGVGMRKFLTLPGLELRHLGRSEMERITIEMSKGCIVTGKQSMKVIMREGIH